MKPYYQDELATIYLGDSRQIAPRVGLVDFIFTDPPYGHNQNKGDLFAARKEWEGRKRGKTIANDSPEAATELVLWLFKTAAQQLRCCCCCCCCCGGGGPDPQFARWSLWMDEELEFKQMVVWDKGRMGMGWHYRRSYETVLVGQKGKGKTRWFDRTRRVENIIRPGDYGIRKVMPGPGTHPTPKPPELAAHFIKLHTLKGHLVLDPFMGAGSTLIAAKRLGRRVVGIELDRRWCRQAAEKLESEPLPDLT